MDKYLYNFLGEEFLHKKILVADLNLGLRVIPSTTIYE